MMTYYIPSLDAICYFPVLLHCYDVVLHEKKQQKDPHVMAVRANKYWALESMEPLDLEKIHTFLSNPSTEIISAAYEASTKKMYGSPSASFTRIPFHVLPNKLLEYIPGPEID